MMCEGEDQKLHKDLYVDNPADFLCPKDGYFVFRITMELVRQRLMVKQDQETQLPLTAKIT